jgi:hypothetical protein
MLTFSQGTVFKTAYSAPSMSNEKRSILTKNKKITENLNKQYSEHMSSFGYSYQTNLSLSPYHR